jgi:hypothetical protein
LLALALLLPPPADGGDGSSSSSAPARCCEELAAAGQYSSDSCVALWPAWKVTEVGYSAHLCFSHALFFFLSLEHRSRDMQFAYPQSQYGILLFESNLISVKFIYLAVDIFDCEKIGNHKVINKLVPFV